jgi:hypothetical protein
VSEEKRKRRRVGEEEKEAHTLRKKGTPRGEGRT